MISVHCSDCGHSKNLPDQLAGQPTRCPNCKSYMRAATVRVAEGARKPELPSLWWHVVPLLLLGSAGWFGLLCWMSNAKQNNTSQSQPAEPAPVSSRPWRGETGRLHTTEGGPLAVSIDRSAFDESGKYVSAKDRHGFGLMLLSGRLYAVDDGTRIVAIDPGLLTYEVRILDGPHAGKLGIVPSEWVQK